MEKGNFGKLGSGQAMASHVCQWFSNILVSGILCSLKVTENFKELLLIGALYLLTLAVL